MSTTITLNSTEATPDTTDPIPTEVMEAYEILPHRIRPLGGGIVNLTYLASTPDTKLVLQRLDPDTPAESFQDFDAYTDHLIKEGWEAPEINPTSSGQSYFTDSNKNIWRSMTYIECDEGRPVLSCDESLRNIGRLLANWHISMSSLEYSPKYQIPNFHDTDYHIGELASIQEELPIDEGKSLAEEIVLAREHLDDMPHSSEQLIHGDPKIANILFRKKLPFTFIDFDTVMRGTTWLDIGDVLRSIIKVEACTSNEAQNAIRYTAAAYHETTSPEDNIDDFTDKARAATKLISLELASRYLVDIVKATNFTWDYNQFPDRASNHLDRARKQWEMFKKI